MQVVSVNVGLPRDVLWNGKTVSTGIFKEPVADRVVVRRLNLEGDRQADLSVHGGQDKAIYVYPAEHYHYWREQFPDQELPWSMFGENLTVEGMPDEASISIGDQFSIGTARVVVTQPRLPCYKLGIKFGRQDILQRFLASNRTGFYLAVLEEGMVQAGDAISFIKRDESGISITDIIRLYAQDKHNLSALQRVVAAEVVPENWRTFFSERMQRLTDS